MRLVIIPGMLMSVTVNIAMVPVVKDGNGNNNGIFIEGDTSVHDQ